MFFSETIAVRLTMLVLSQWLYMLVTTSFVAMVTANGNRDEKDPSGPPTLDGSYLTQALRALDSQSLGIPTIQVWGLYKFSLV